MTDKEIIKALECCIKFIDCTECPYKGITKCSVEVDALDLINRQQAEIERLTAGQEILHKCIASIKAEAITDFAKRLREKSVILHFAEYPYRAVKVLAVCDITAVEKELTEGQK